MEKTIKGICHGVEISEYPLADRANGKQIQIIVEDDGNWFKQAGWFSSLWLDDLIEVLLKAKKECDK